MTYTHISHFGLKELSRTQDVIVLGSPTLGAVKRIAAAHGFEIESEITLNYNSMDTTVVIGWHMRNHDNHRAMIRKWSPDTWCISMQTEAWNQHI